MKRFVKVIISTISIALLLQSMIFAAPASETPEQPEQAPAVADRIQAAADEMVNMLENNLYALYVNQKTGQFYVQCKTSGKLWWSTPPLADEDELANGRNKMEMKSNLVIRYVDMATEETDITNSFTASVNREQVTVQKEENKVVIAYKMLDYKLYIPLIIELTEDGFSAYVDTARILEGGDVKIFAISVLPYFGAAYQDEEGYLFVPDGSGAIINFNNNKHDYDQYSENVYGADDNFDLIQKNENKQAIRLPVFGLKNGNNSFLGIITEGAGIATIDAIVSGNNSGYNNIFTSFNLRYIGVYYLGQSMGGSITDIDLFEIGSFDIEKIGVSYHLLSGEDCGYTRMAKVYRDYLIKTYGINKLDSWAPELHLELMGAVRKQERFLGIPFTVTKGLTTFEKAEEILKQLKESDVDRIAVQYVNWEKNAIKGKINDKASVVGQIGGKSGLRQLLEYTDSQSIPIYLDVDYTKIDSFSFSFPERKAAVKNLSKKTVMSYTYSYVNFFKDSMVAPQYLLSPTQAVKAFTKFLGKYEKISTGNISLGNTASMLYSDFSDDSFCREDSAARMAELAKLASEENSVMLRAGNAYSLPYADRVIDASNSSSDYDVFDYSVPFYQIALYGYVNTSASAINLSSNYKKEFLKAIEYLSSLHYSWIGTDTEVIRDTALKDNYSADYRNWIDQAISYSKELTEIFKNTENSDIKNHQQLQNGVYRIDWENGFAVIVNYNSDRVELDGVAVEGESYRMLKQTADGKVESFN